MNWSRCGLNWGKKWTEINSEQIWEDMVPAGWRFFARCFHHRKCKAWDFFWHNIWLGTNFQPFHMQAWNEVPRTSGEDGRPKFLVAWSIVWFRRHTPKQNCHVLQSRWLWWTATNFARSNQQCDQKGCRGMVKLHPGNPDIPILQRAILLQHIAW